MSLTHAVGWALVHFVWQGAVVGAAAWLVLSLTRRAASRYVVAAAALGVAALLFVATTVAARGGDAGGAVPPAPGAEPVAGPATPARGASPGSRTPPVGPLGEPRGAAGPPATVAGRPPFVPVGSPLHRAVEPRLPLLVTLWLAGVLLLAVRLLGGWAAARRLVREGTRPVADAWREAAARLAERVGVRRAVRVLESAVAAVPAVVGWLSPVILVPASAFTGLTPRQLEVLIAHELAHVRRHDYLVNLFQCAIETLLFYHPAIWWLSSRLREEREHCCDDIAVAVTGNARDYAEALLDLERLRLRTPGLAMAATGGSLLERVRRLVTPGDAHGETFPRWSAGALVVMLVATGAVAPWLAAAPASEALPIFARAPRATSTAASNEPASPGAPVEPQKPEQQRRDSTRWNPDTVIRHADPSRPLDERLAWARAEAARRRDRAYWIGYTVRPLAWARGAIYGGSGVSFFTDDGSTFISGTMFNIGDPSRIRMSGARLLPLLGGRADDAAILLGYQGTGSRPALTSANVVTLALSFEFDRRPVYWLGSADDAQSIPLLRGLFGAGGAEELRNALVRAIGVHRTSDLVAPVLMPIVESRSPDGLRAEAAEWLGRHPHRGGLRLLARTARGDRSANVRAEAAEAVGDMALPEAFDTLAALARTLEDARAREEAVEALGQRLEPDAVRVLADIARTDRDPQVQREAAETLGDFEDGRGAELLEQLARTHPRPDVREEAVETLAYAAAPADAATILERIARSDPHQGVRHEAIESLAEVRDGRGLPVLRDIARNHPDRDLRRQAVEDLGPHLPTDEAFAFLREVVERDPAPDVQREAVETLGDLHDDRAVPILVNIAQRHPSIEVAREAVETLGAFQTPAAAAALERLAREHRSWQVQVEAVETLGEGHDRDPAALRQVAAIATDHPDKRVRIEAIETYGEHAPGEAVAALLGRIIDRERDEAVLHEALETAMDLEGGAGIALVIRVAERHENPRVRALAIEELRDSDDPRARAALARLRRSPER